MQPAGFLKSVSLAWKENIGDIQIFAAVNKQIRVHASWTQISLNKSMFTKRKKKTKKQKPSVNGTRKGYKTFKKFQIDSLCNKSGNKCLLQFL